MDSYNKNTTRRKAQSIQDMINSTPATGSGLKKSGYSGPKNATGRVTGNTQSLYATSDLSGINVNKSLDYDRWGNSNEGMPKPKKPRYKADVANPMRGNFLKRDLEQSKERLERKSKEIDRGRSRNIERNDRYVAPAYRGPLDSYGWIIYTVILVICVTVTLISSGVKPRGLGYVYPMNVITISGVVNSAYEHRMGIKSAFDTSNNNAVSDSTDSSAIDSSETIGNTKDVEAVDPNSLTDLGSDGEAATLDDGSMEIPGITQATSHEELVQQIQAALSAGNYSFISAKFAYEDENTGQLDAYPMSQIKHFCEYMSNNPDKITSFINNISSQEYSATNGTAYILKLPIMKFTVKMGESTDTFVLDNTVVKVSGFSDVIVNGNQNAAIYPLLPCMYTVTLTNNAWATPSQSQEIEATLGEGNLEIKVGQASE